MLLCHFWKTAFFKVILYLIYLYIVEDQVTAKVLKLMFVSVCAYEIYALLACKRGKLSWHTKNL